MSHVKTFDGLEYDFEAAPCGYDLVEVGLNDFLFYFVYTLNTKSTILIMKFEVKANIEFC